VAKKSNRGRRYTAVQKQQILSAASKENLTGAQVKKRFGISTLTFYRWRGPVRGRRAKVNGAGKGRSGADGTLRQQVRSEVQRVLPQVIREEVASYLNEVLRPRA